MTHFTRREFSSLTLAGVAGLAIAPRDVFGAPKIDSTFNGVLIGTQSYSFRDMPLDDAIVAMKEIGLGEVELWQGHVEPRPERPPRPAAEGDGARGSQGPPRAPVSGVQGAPRVSDDARTKLREWRLSTPLSHFEAIGRKFADAGIEVYAYNYSVRDDFSDEEIARGFEMAKALGAKVITASSNVTTATRVGPFAAKHKMRVGMHNHSNIKENEFATPDDFTKAMALGGNEYIVINLDIGHFTAANFDAVDFLKKHHDKIVTLHIKDRKKNQGDNVIFGEGDTPIKEVLQTLKANKWPIPANIEYEYKGADTKTEVKRCFEYCKAALA